MANVDFQKIFSNDFQSIDHFKKNVLEMVFGDLNCVFDDSEYEDLTLNPDYAKIAKNANLKKFAKVQK